MLPLALRSIAKRSLSSSTAAAAAPAAHIDWTQVRAKMMSEETRVEADRARDVYQKRLSSAEGVRAAADIDWESYAKALPEVDVAAIKAGYLKAAGAIPEVKYDPSADLKAHEAKEAAWTGFSAYCASRVKELELLAGEQEKHKLHRFYRRRQLYSRFPGLYESLHHKVRGQWDVEVWAQYLAYRAKLTNLPWDPNHGEVTAQKKAELKAAIAAKAGTTLEALGWSK